MNKKLIHGFISFLILSLFTVQPLFAAAKTTKIKVTFVSASLVENNHVGNEWWSGGTVNGKELGEGQSTTLSLKSTDTIKLVAEAQEQDKYPDNGEATTSIKAASITKTITKSLTLSIIENRGRYSGNTAKWKFVFKIEKVK